MLDRLQRLQTFRENEDSVLQPPANKANARKTLPSAATLKRRHSSRINPANGPQISSRSSTVDSVADSSEYFEFDDDDWIDGEPLVKVSKQYAFLWWIGVFLAVVGPEFIAYWADVHDTLRLMRAYEKEIISFPKTHPLYVPQPNDETQNFNLVDKAIISWQEDLTKTYRKVLSLKVLDAVSDNNLEFTFATGRDEFDPRRDVTIFLYFLMCLAVYFTDNVHLALVLLHFNLYNLVVCIRVKSLDDAVGKSLQPLQDSIQAFLLLGFGKTEYDTARQQFLLTKLEAMLKYWESQNLGISFSVPYVRTVLSLNIGLLISLVAATTVRCLNVVLYGFYPTLPRVNFFQLALQWLLGSHTAATLTVENSGGSFSSKRQSAAHLVKPSTSKSSLAKRSEHSILGLEDRGCLSDDEHDDSSPFAAD